MNTESEINFKDIVLYVLNNILIIIIVGAIVGCALGFSNYTEIKKTNDVLDITKKLNASETDLQYETRVLNVNRARTYAKMITNVNKQIDYQREYIADSIFMQIDSENFYQYTAQLSLVLDDSNYIGMDKTLFSAYEREVGFSDYLQEYADKNGVKPEYIKELISINCYSPDNSVINLSNNEFDKIGSIFISVYGPSSEFCDEVMNLVLAKFDAVHSELNRTVFQHKLSVVGVQRTLKSDNSIRDAQISYTSRIDSLQAQIVNYLNGIDNIAKELGLSGKEVIIKYFATHEEVIVDGVPTVYSEQVINGHKDFKALSGQFGIGFGIGAGAIIVLLVICYLCSRNIKTQAQFFGIFPNITKIGVMKPSVKNGYSKLINKCSEDDSKLSTDNINKLISTNCNNITKNYQKVLITGIGDKSAMEKAVKALNIKGDFKPDMFNNPEVLDLVPNYDCVVLLEQRKKSLYRDIKNEIRLISNAGTKIVGAILI